MSAALVPVKRLSDGKSRLLPELGADARETLCLAMLGDLLEALGASERVSRVAVVTPDDDVAELARGAGAVSLRFERPGLNPALDHGAAALALGTDEALLVVLGDVAGARAEDIDALYGELDSLGGRGVVLAASSDGGSAALLRSPHDAIPTRFGRASAKAHRDEAEGRGVPFCECVLESLALDLDDADDVERFLATASAGGARTRALLHSLGWQRERAPEAPR